jgi:DNA repair photolyase
MYIQYHCAMGTIDRRHVRVGRGAASNPVGRFAATRSSAADDGWGILEEALPDVETVVQAESARTIITRNRSPDIPFSQSINPYRGCEHGCVYCYARPAHAYMDLSPGLDFETRLFYKPDAATLLEQALTADGYRCSPIALGTNTDPYQPIERRLGITRAILELLSSCQHPATIVTKGAALIARDAELLASMAERRLMAVFISITTLDKDLKRKLEPRAASAATRLNVIRNLARLGIPVGVMVAPVIPVLTDHELERILEAAAEAGASAAGYLLLRLPNEVNGLFQEWLETHVPLAARHVMGRIHELRGGRANDPRFGTRQRGEGVFAALLARRFERARRSLRLDGGESFALDTSRFTPPVPQLRLI